MPGGDPKYKLAWLQQDDGTGRRISEWCEKDGDHGHCFVCEKEVPCHNSGVKQVQQHAKGAKHQKAMSLRQPPRNQTTLWSPASSDSRFCMAFNDHVTNAEIIWATNIAYHVYSFSSCNDVKTLETMFSDS